MWSSNKTTQQNRRDRATLLSALSKAVKQVPSRTSLVVAGDFNASLQPSARLVGPLVCHAAPRPDGDGLQALVEELKLVALNTWHTSKPHTFVQDSSLSQIDFVFTKEIESGSRAKLATPLHDWHLGSWKVGGHLPIAATIQLIGHWMLPAPKKPAQYDLQQLQHAVREGSDEAEAMRAWVAERMPTTHPDESNAVLLEAAALFFPKAPRPDAAHRTAASRDMWRLAKELKHSSEADPQKTAELEAAQALHRQQAQRRQKERAAKFLERVDAAIAEGASQIAYSTLKYLRPWQAPSRAQLKD